MLLSHVPKSAQPWFTTLLRTVFEQPDTTAVQAAGQVLDRATGTYGSHEWTVFHADDVQRVADAIADGTAVLQPRWRKDTEEGSEELRQRIKKLDREVMLGRLVVSAIVLLLVVGFGVLIYLA
ncbi:hypothetical protein ACWEFL_08195 [Streptomyces sp. NPDC004838]